LPSIDRCRLAAHQVRATAMKRSARTPKRYNRKLWIGCRSDGTAYLSSCRGPDDGLIDSFAAASWRLVEPEELKRGFSTDKHCRICVRRKRHLNLRRDAATSQGGHSRSGHTGDRGSILPTVFVVQSWPAAYLPRARRVVTRIGHAPTPRPAPQLTSVKFDDPRRCARFVGEQPDAGLTHTESHERFMTCQHHLARRRRCRRVVQHRQDR
jgi:hypothetical protein